MNHETPADPNAELAAALHDLADKIAAYTGSLSTAPRILFYVHGNIATRDQAAVDTVDAIATALLGEPGSHYSELGRLDQHRIDRKDRGLQTCIYTYVPKPADEDPAVLRAEIAALKAQLAAGGEQA